MGAHEIRRDGAGTRVGLWWGLEGAQEAWTGQALTRRRAQQR